VLVVADTSALLALAACDGLPLLDSLYGDVRVPRAVYHECTIPGKSAADVLVSYLRDKVLDVNLGAFVIAATGLGQGELEAMALYRRLDADHLLIDDDRARRVARLNKMRVIGSVGVLLVAKAEGLVPMIKPRLQAMRAGGVRLGALLEPEALRLAGEEVDK
jgi:hypothetical protein